MKQATVNTLGALGYSSVIIQWFWSILTIGLAFFTSNLMQELFLPPKRPASDPPPSSIELPGSLEIIITIVSVILALGIIVYALLAIPKAIGRGGQHLTRRSAKIAMPHLASRQHSLSKKQRRRLYERVTWSIKLLLICIPLLLLMIPPAPALGLPHAVVASAGMLFGAASLVLFGIQYILVHHWRIPAKHVW